jgi:hypothetical protein
MKEYDRRFKVPQIREIERESFDDYLARTRDPNAHKRARAIREFCPCKVQKDIDEVWQRIFEM